MLLLENKSGQEKHTNQSLSLLLVKGGLSKHFPLKAVDVGIPARTGLSSCRSDSCNANSEVPPTKNAGGGGLPLRVQPV